MTEAPGKAAKKVKVKPQTPEERMEALRYNHMMYGRTANEMSPNAKKVDYGAPYLKHPKFQGLMSAFKNGTKFQFSVVDKGKTHIISTDGTHINFNEKVIFYSRALNKYERSLLMDRSVVLQHKTIDAFVHMVIAVIRFLPELDSPALTFRNNEFLYGDTELSVGIAEQGPNILIGGYKINLGKTK